MREAVEVRFWCVWPCGHADGDPPLGTFPTPGQADAFARGLVARGKLPGGAAVVPTLLVYRRNRAPTPEESSCPTEPSPAA